MVQLYHDPMTEFHNEVREIGLRDLRVLTVAYLGFIKTLDAVRPAIHEEGIVPSRSPLAVAIEPAQYATT